MWQRKDERILEGAEQLFMDRGYIHTSMDAIATEAGVSKQTLYHHYGSKEMLFGAIVSERVERLLLPLRADDLMAKPPREALMTLGLHFLEAVLSPSSLALHRAIVAEAPRQPELGRVTYEQGGERSLAVLSDYLEELARQGKMRVDDTAVAAEQFYGMLLGFRQFRALVGIGPDPGPQEIEQSVRAAVDAFLAAYGADPRHP